MQYYAEDCAAHADTRARYVWRTFCRGLSGLAPSPPAPRLATQSAGWQPKQLGPPLAQVLGGGLEAPQL